ncbi:ABC transporter substrate-binding protein [Rhodococcus aetherivorans]
MAQASAAVLLTAGLTACGGSSGTDDDSTIQIAMLAPLTGGYAADSNPKAIELAEKLIEADGGVAGKQVKVTIYDAGSEPQTALNAANRAVSDRADVVVGGITTSQLKAIEPIIARAKIPHLHLANVAGDTAYNLNPPQTASADATVRFAQNVLKAQNAAALTTSDEGSMSNAKDILDAAQKAGLPITVDQNVAPTATDITPQVRNMRDVDVVLQTAVPAIDTITIRTMTQNAIDIPVILSLGGIFQVTSQLTPADQLANVYINSICAASVPLEAQDNEKAKAYLEAFSNEFGDGLVQSPLAPRFFDAVNISAQIATSADSPEERIEYIDSSLEYEGVCGNYTSNDSRYLAAPENAFVMSAADGTLTRAQ